MLPGDGILLNRPVFRSSYDVQIVDSEHVLLLNERENRLLTGRVYVALAPLLSGTRDIDELFDAASSSATPAEIVYALDRLHSLGVVREARGSLSAEAERFWDALGVDPAAAADRLAAATVGVAGVGGVSTAALRGALSQLGVATADEAETSVVLTDDYLHDDLALLDQRRLREGRRWLLAKPAGTTIWIGPLLAPSKACWECLAHRLRTRQTAATYLRARGGSAARPRMPNGALASTELAAAALIATEIAKWLAGAPASGLEESLLTLDLTTMTTERHAVVKRPQCRACGDATPRHAAPLRLVSRARTPSPEATLVRYGHQVSSLTGAVSELVPAPGLDLAVAPVFASGPNAAVRSGTIDALVDRFRAVSSGKGRSEAQARASALGEATERYSGVFEGDEQRVRKRLEDFGAGTALDPNDCMRFSDAQYARRAAPASPRYLHVPEPFDPRAEIDWSPLWSLTENRFKYLPTAYCYYDVPPEGGARFCRADSNGCAAGDSIEEAVLQGFIELVERDSVALWWYNRARRPAVDIRSFDDPYFDRLQRYYGALGRDLVVLDITGDLGIPCFAAISRRTGSPGEEITFGFGAHLDPRLAVSRAVTEANQFLAVVIGRHADPPAEFRTGDPVITAWLQTATLADQPYLAPLAGAAKTAVDYVSRQHDDVKADVDLCVSLAAARGMETLVLDQTRPDIGMPVVRVVVPGLRHFWPRFGAGRLYDVPPRLGWTAAPALESELNPLAVFL